MSEISASYQPNKIKRKGYTSWIDESNLFCTTTTGITLDKVRGQNLMDAFDVDWSAYKIDGLTASATAIINKLNTPATAINNFLGVLEDLNQLLDSQDRSTKEGSYWIVGADIDIIIGEKTYKSLHTGDLVIINVGAHDYDIEDASGFEECYYCVLINMSGYLPLIGGTMTGAIDFEWNGPDIHNMLTWRKQGILLLDETDLSKLYLGTAAKLPLTVHELTTGSVNFNGENTTIYEENFSLYIQAYGDIYLKALGTWVDSIFPTTHEAFDIGSNSSAFKDIYAKRFIIPGGTGNLVLLDNGGVKPLSEFTASSGITKLNVGGGLQGKDNNGDLVDAITTSVGTITLKTASNNEIGGIKLGYLTNGKNYPVNVNTAGQAYVNVPWTNTDSKVTQSRSTSNGAYPLLCKYDTKPGEPTTNSVNFVSEVTVNPSTGAVNAPAFYETSDARKKEIKSDLSLDRCYDLIDKCQTVIYSLKDLTQELVGMIAQEIEEFFPEVVATDEEGFKSLAYDRLVVICFKVLKDVIKRLEKLES